MSEKQPMVVLLRQEHLGKGGVVEAVLAESGVKRASTLDSVSIMQTESKPGPEDLLETQEFGVGFADLTETEAEQLRKSPEIDEVVPDEMQYAFTQAPERPTAEEPEDVAFENYDEPVIELDDEEIRALNDDLADMMGIEDADDVDVAPTADELALLTRQQPSLTEDEVTVEHALLDLGEEIFMGQPTPAEVTPAKLAPAIRGLFAYMKEQEKGLVEVSDEEIESVLRASRFREALSESLAPRDFILRNIRQVYASIAWRFSRGRGVRVAIVDTGVSPHRDLRLYGGVSFVPGVTSWRDDNGHGTHVAGTAGAALNNYGIAGVAPDARLYAVKVLNRQGRGRLSAILNGLAWCYRRRMHVVNLSLGSPWPRHNPREFSTAYERYGRLLRRRGILAVAAAGNDRGRPVSNPARCPSFMAVSAIDAQRRRAAFSNLGPQVEICAPGVQILSTVPGGYSRKSGTSMASPHVAGAAALMKSRHRTWHGDVIRRRMMSTALDLGGPGRDWVFGFGQVNAYRSAR